MNLQKKYTKDPNIVFRKVVDECILVPVKQKADELDSIFTLNTVGSRIWELIDGEKSITDIKEILINEYEVTTEEAEADLKEFIKKLEQIGAVRAE
jgi:hypothetical protein